MVLTVALKEWAVVVEALLRGRQTVLLRKGGLLDRGGSFDVEHRDFLLYPTTEHQRTAGIRKSFHQWLEEAPPEPTRVGQSVRFTGAAHVTDVFAVSEPKAIEALTDEHILSEAQIAQRFLYKPERPLAVLVVRALRLAEPREVPFVARYAGCRSWVPLEDPVGPCAAAPVLTNALFEERRERVRRALTPFLDSAPSRS